MKDAAYYRAQYARHAERKRVLKRAWNAKNREKISAQRRLKYRTDPEFRARRRARERGRVGLPAPTRRCPDVCECCGKPPRVKSLALDHDHETGEFRGWLCINCNIGLGNLGDTIESIERALAYLTRVSTHTKVTA